jgi:hypothetical protein
VRGGRGKIAKGETHRARPMRRSVRLVAGRLPVMIGQDLRGRDADEKGRNGIVVAVLFDSDDGGRRFAIREAGEQGEVGVIPETSASKAVRWSAVMFVAMARLLSF